MKSHASCNEKGKKQFERYLNEIDGYLPKHCPNCGAPLIRISKDGKIWIMPLGKGDITSLKIHLFDVYCDSCEWSGEISPDSLREQDVVLSKERVQ